MAVLAVPNDHTFEVSGNKIQQFNESVKNSNGKQFIESRLQKHDKGNVTWETKK